MKKIILSFAIAFVGMISKSSSQCTVNNLAVQLKSITTMGNECYVVFDLSWNQEVNNGNKYACLHLWRSDQYPDLNANGLAYTNTSDQPINSDLLNALATIVIERNGTTTPVIGSVYDADPSVAVLSAGLEVEKEKINDTWERMTVSNISLTIPACTGSSITGDIWASQADHGQNVHCVSSGVSIVVGNPRVTGLLDCQVPHQYSVQVSNVSDAGIDVWYNVYIDEGDGIYEPSSHDLKITGTPVGPITIETGNTYNSGLQSYLPYSTIKEYSDHGLWVEVRTAGIPNVTIYYISNSCVPLQVNLDVFNAVRDHSIVYLLWETATETNNKGFEIQRKIGEGNFQPVAFIPSGAVMGNSQNRLRYTYNDFNPATGITEYRIMQVDLDGRTKYSAIRAVSGEGQKNEITIYPNPAVSGIVKVILKDSRVKYDITLFDVGGRVLKTWKNFTDQILFIDNILPGFYTLQIINAETKDKAVEKIVVQK